MDMVIGINGPLEQITSSRLICGSYRTHGAWINPGDPRLPHQSQPADFTLCLCRGDGGSSAVRNLASDSTATVDVRGSVTRITGFHAAPLWVWKPPGEKAHMSAPPLIRAPSPLPFSGGANNTNTGTGGGGGGGGGIGEEEERGGGGGVISFHIQIGLSREPVLLDAAGAWASVRSGEVACSIVTGKV
ncbi:nuclear factor 7, brain-like protein [Lates japonicus]|uniref:Nuclear factor 7, brain-like protein n=1 Tax=Lates japonicus TaxID=270547 RepID=A0AAD3NCN3_LATJO|nr:nuclear factor 7, brain-like protein [Lates japonicus]